MFKFITRQHFLVNLLVALLLAAGIIFGTLQMLGVLTKHGDFLKVPTVVSLRTQEAVQLLENKGFDVIITDSVYVDSIKMGTVIKQIPDPNSTVKVNRTILLVVNRETLPMVDVPALQGKSITYALELLKRSHLTLGDTTFRADFMQGSVLEQKYHGALINPGSKLQWGSKIDLVIGGGLSEVRLPVPDLVGLTYTQAKAQMEEAGINLGALIFEGSISDTLGAYVFRQNPLRWSENEPRTLQYIQSGQLIDLYISAAAPTISPADSARKPKPKPAPVTN